jgi:2-polyprenyl-6-methoxyphenol hydroxylase-like FAD-dependent oxidoreductase
MTAPNRDRCDAEPVRVVIAGGGGTGCFAALLLARAGHEVIVVERESREPAPDAETAAASAFRPTAPQIVQPHIVMARCRELLIEHLPDVYGALLKAGVVEAPLPTQMPASLPDQSPRPGDERLTQLLTRRYTVDWVLLRAVMAEPGVTFRPGVRVTGLLAETASNPPHVTGIRTGGGDITADLVVDATGRGSVLDTWLAGIGARPAASQSAECGLAYYSRHYRLRPGLATEDLPGSPFQRLVMALDEFLVGLWPADNETMQLGVVPLAADRRFRAVRDPDVFTRVLRAVPAYSEWLEVLSPITGVFPMGGLHNTFRRLVVDGKPLVTGLHAVGDTVCTTNPTLARGLALAMTSAVDLATTVAGHEHDPYARALALDDLATAHVEPFYVEQALVDGARLAQMRHLIFGDPEPAPRAEADNRVTYGQVRAAMPFDPVAFRAFWKVMGMITTPEEAYTDPEVVGRTRTVLQARGEVPPAPGPTREQLIAVLSG